MREPFRFLQRGANSRLQIAAVAQRGRQRHPLGVLAFGLLGVAGLLSACVSPSAPHGEVAGQPFSSSELMQTDSNRMVSLAMQQNLDGLFALMDKLYQRNPREWRKTAASREAAMAFVRITVLNRQGWAPLGQARDIEALSYALDPQFEDDRVAAFTYAAADTLITAHGGKINLTMIDGLNAQNVYNAARNMEIAAWILATRRTAEGEPLLLSNEISEMERNLSFEREVGKIIARLDLVASYSTENYRRALIGYGQSWVAGPLLQFLPVDALVNAVSIQ